MSNPKLDQFHCMVKEIAHDIDVKRSAWRAMGGGEISIDEQSCKHLSSILRSFIDITDAMQTDLCMKQIEIERLTESNRACDELLAVMKASDPISMLIAWWKVKRGQKK